MGSSSPPLALVRKGPKVLLAVAACALFLPGTSGCSDGHCTDKGCESGARFDVQQLKESDPNGYVRICANERCEDVKEGAAGFVPVDLANSKLRSASASLLDASGSVTFQAEWTGAESGEERRPNGMRCPPTCHVVTLVASSDDTELHVAKPGG